MIRLLMPLATGFEETEAVAVIDVLRRSDISIITASVTQEIAVQSARKVTIVADTRLSKVGDEQWDGIVLPGGEPGTTHLQTSSQVIDLIQRMASQQKLVAAICAAPRILANLGLLEGKRATSFPAVQSEMSGALYSEDRVVQDGIFITSRAVGSALEFGLAIVTYFLGVEYAEQLAKKMLL